MGTPIRADQHEVGHNGDDSNRGQLAVSTILKWHASIYAYLMQKLKSTPEGSGNMLDNTVLVFMPEGQVRARVIDAIHAAGLVFDHAPIVGFGPNAANPHYEPVPGQDLTLSLIHI